MLSPPDVAEKDPPDLLNKKKCLEYLAALRHAKWFQVNSSEELHIFLFGLWSPSENIVLYKTGMY